MAIRTTDFNPLQVKQVLPRNPSSPFDAGTALALNSAGLPEPADRAVHTGDDYIGIALDQNAMFQRGATLIIEDPCVSSPCHIVVPYRLIGEISDQTILQTSKWSDSDPEGYELYCREEFDRRTSQQIRVI